LSLNVFRRLKISFFLFFFVEEWPTRSSKNGTNSVFNNMVQSYRVFIHRRNFYIEKSNLEQWVTRRLFYKKLDKYQKSLKLWDKLVKKIEKFQWSVFIFFLWVTNLKFLKRDEYLSNIYENPVKFHHLIKNIIRPIFGWSSWSQNLLSSV
jgi:hypothetical protein